MPRQSRTCTTPGKAVKRTSPNPGFNFKGGNPVFLAVFAARAGSPDVFVLLLAAAVFPLPLVSTPLTMAISCSLLPDCIVSPTSYCFTNAAVAALIGSCRCPNFFVIKGVP
jgi:hypothetical protein